MPVHLHPSGPIGIFDSGIGGLTVAKAIADLLPQESLLYVGDTAHLPYGSKPAAFIRQRSLAITEYLLNQGCKIIVVACNTASAAALHTLRETWPDAPIVGMEPAVKPAVQASSTRKIGVLATAGTIRSERYADLIHRFAKDVEVFEDPCTGLVELIESGQSESAATAQLLRNITGPMLHEGADVLVLGCTHYHLVASVLEDIAGPAVHIINPAPAVARQVQRMLTRWHLLLEEGQPAHRFLATGSGDGFRFVLPLCFPGNTSAEAISLPDQS